MRRPAGVALRFAALLALAACTRVKSHPPIFAEDATSEATTVSVAASSALPSTVSVQNAGELSQDAGAVDAAASRSECRCTAPSTPKQVALSAPGALFDGPSPGLGYVLLTDDENLCYSAVALYAPEG